MKTAIFFCAAVILTCGAPSIAQTHTAISLGSSIPYANCNGYYRYLPADYNNTTKNYPLILWLHGAGQIGNGSPADLAKILEWGTPKVISEGDFPQSFTVGDSSFSFIIISPQFTGWPSATNVSAMINYAKTNFRINVNRIYLMGISAGGGGVWNYCSASTSNSSTVAAVIPFCGTTQPSQTLANRIAAANLPVWAFHNTHDGTVPVAYSRNWINYINAYYPAPSPAARLTEFPVQSNDAVIAHECWSLATLPSYKPNGINIYEWLLLHARNAATVNLPPQANAGADVAVTLPASAQLNGSGSSDADGVLVSYTWQKISGPSAYTIANANSASTSVSGLEAGTYQFRLTVADNAGATASDDVTVTAYAPLPEGAQQRVLIDIGSTNGYGGTQTNSPSLNNLTWNNMTDARPGLRISNAKTTTNQNSSIALEVINRIDGTYNTGSNGMGNGNTAGNVGDYPSSATTDHALIHRSAGNGLWRIKGLDASKTYSIKFWGTRSNTSAPRDAEIKREDETTWKYYSATGNNNFDHAASFTVTGKTEIGFNIRTRQGSDYSALNVIDIRFAGEAPAPENAPPVADAGADQNIQMPANSSNLDGSNSSDPENAIQSYQWVLLSGPLGSIIASPNAAVTSVRFQDPGTYRFRLTVTDTASASAADEMIVNVIPVASPAITKTINVNLFGGSNPYGHAAWNNWNIAASTGSALFTYDDASPSAVSASITDAGIITDNGANYAAGATAFPPQVVRYNTANTSYRTLSISGLEQDKTYDLRFFASRANTGNSTRISIGSLSDTIATSGNINDFASFTNLVPGANGRIEVIIDRIGTWNYLAGFSIVEHDVPENLVVASTIAQELSAQEQLVDARINNHVPFELYPNPVTDKFTINFPVLYRGRYYVSVLDNNGKVLMQESGIKNDGGLYRTFSAASLEKGRYVLQLTLENEKVSKPFIRL